MISTRSRPTSLRRRNANSLVEVLAAAAVFSVAVLLVFATFNLTLRLNQLAKEDSVAANLAEETIESYRAMSFDAIVAPIATVPVATSRLPDGWLIVTTSYYQDNTKVKQIQVQVYWRNRPQSRAVTATTLKTLGGIDN